MLIFTAFCLIIPLWRVVKGNVFSLGPSLTHRVQLDTFGNYFLEWTPKEEEIVFEVQVKTRGYVGLGFSPSGGMNGADILIGWVDNAGEVHLTDRHASGKRTPNVDTSQDHYLVGGFANDTHTVIRFKRPWVTCDTLNDYALSEDTVRVIWAYDSLLPDPLASNLKYHDHRGTKSIYLKDKPILRPTDFNENLYWDVTAPQVRIPENLTTLYWCKLYKVPDLRKKHQMIGYIPLLDKTNGTQVVHHMLLYECSLMASNLHLQKWVDRAGAQCYTRNMPLSWSTCGTPIVVWAIGSEGEMLPEHVGFPLGEEHGGATYFLLEVHYDNPFKMKDIVDSSGIRLFLTDQPRVYDAAVLTVGHKVEPSMIVPPGELWTTVGHCTSACTSKALPSEGINLFSGVLHAHLLGHSISVQHLRDGKEIERLIEDKSYDFNYQQARFFPNEKKLLPGDHLITKCTYDATKKKTPTFGGFATNEEMCLVFFAYYPKLEWAECYSRPDLALLFDIFGIHNLYENDKVMRIFSQDAIESSFIDFEKDHELWESMPKSFEKESMEISNFEMVDFFRIVNISEPSSLKDKTFYDLLTSDSTWKDKDLLSKLKQAVSELPYEPRCLLNGRAIMKNLPQKAKVPHYIPLQPGKRQCKTLSDLQNMQTSPLDFAKRHQNIFTSKSSQDIGDSLPVQSTNREESIHVGRKYSGQGKDEETSSIQKLNKNSGSNKIRNSSIHFLFICISTHVMNLILCIHSTE